MALVWLGGILSRDPKEQTLNPDWTFVDGTLSVRDAGDVTTLWYVTAFDGAARAELMLLRKSEALEVHGPMFAFESTRDNGKPRANLGIIAESIYSAGQPRGHSNKTIHQASRRSRLERAINDGVDKFGKPLPFLDPKKVKAPAERSSPGEREPIASSTVFRSSVCVKIELAPIVWTAPRGF